MSGPIPDEVIASIKTATKGFTPFVIALTIVAPLWGVTIAQASAYFRGYYKDRLFLKLLVGFCVILTTAQLGTLIYTIYFWLIICRIPQNWSFLGALVESLVVLPAYLTYFLTTVVQLFYAMRVYYVSNGSWILTGLIAGLSVVQLVGGFALVSYMVTIGSIVAVYSKFNKISGSIELSSSMLCDIIISGSLAWLLRQNKQNSFRTTRRAIDRLILYSVNIGILTNLICLANFVTWLAAPEEDFTWAVFHFALGKIYVNSMLVSLNARDRIRNEMMSGAYKQATSMFDVDGVGNKTKSVSEIQMGRVSAKESTMSSRAF